MDASSPQSRIRFGKFEVDLRSGELRKQGHKIRIQPQPIKLLAVLLERPGELVTRDELRKRLWPSELYVDFEHGLNRSINKLRRALLDEASSPLYIETLATRGYRFIAPVEVESPSVESDPKTISPADSGKPPAVASSSWRQRFILSACAVLLPALIFFSIWRPSQPISVAFPVNNLLRPVPLVSFANGEPLLPAFSPDGSRIAYSWGAADGWHLEVKDVNTDTHLRLTQHGADFPPGPSWSPDGSQIAFARAGAADERGIYIISSIGGPERKLHSLAFWTVPQRMVSWSPDGRWIAFADEIRADPNTAPHMRAIYLISPQTSEIHKLTQPGSGDYGDSAPTFSPDGSTVAFVRTRADSHDEIYTVSLQGGTPHLLITEGLWTNGLAWTADGKSIVFDRSLAGGFRLWRVSATGNNPVPLDVPCDWTCLEPTLWRNHIAYESHQFIQTVRRAALNGSRSESPMTPVASTRHEHGARFSPDGEHIAFISDRTGAEELWMADPDGSNPIQLTHLGMPALVDLCWHPRGNSIAVSAFSGKVYVVSLDSQNARLLYAGVPFTDETKPNIAFSRNGLFLYVLSQPGTEENYDLLKVPIDGGTPTKVLTGRLTNFAESIDGRMLFYSREDGLWKRPIEGGVEQLVAPPKFRLWDLRGDGLYLVSLSSSIEQYSVDGKHLRTLAKLGQFDLNFPLSISPDARWALVGYSQRKTTEIDMVQGFN